MSESCQVDFYVLARPDQSAQRLACRLAMMAWEQGYRIVVLAGDKSSAAALDEAMWDFPQGRFLPHSSEQDSADAPVAIATNCEEKFSDRDVVINLTDETVPEPGRFRRLLEIVPADDRQRNSSRLKFREYRDLGLNPASHTIGQ